MLNKIRTFSKTVSAKVLIAIIIIPFVFWGMGGLFSGGNLNNIAKINNKNISTQDFMDYVNRSNFTSEDIKANLNNNILEEVLAELISKNMLLMEIEELDLIISDEILNKKLKENENFFDENKNFSRIKYEKFLLSVNLSAPLFELRLKNNELKNSLFKYISGGIKTPIFLINKTFKEKSKKIIFDYIDLKNSYKKKDEFTDKELIEFIEDNKESLKEKIISFNYTKITPNNLIGVNEFNQNFFDKVDEIENDIANGIEFKDLKNKYNLQTKYVENYNQNKYKDNNEIDENYYKKIYNLDENNKLGLLDENDFYLLYQIVKSEKTLPSINNNNFKEYIKKNLVNKSKFDLNNEIIKKISEKKYTRSNFLELSESSSTKIETFEIKSIENIDKFNIESVKYIFNLGKNDFGLITDNKNNIYLINIKNIFEENISKNNKNFLKYRNQSETKIRDNMYGSYDIILNNKYNVKINQKTLERVKNYFR